MGSDILGSKTHGDSLKNWLLPFALIYGNYIAWYFNQLEHFGST
jgi:hypothetical protein